jgi:hypothetical protein
LSTVSLATARASCGAFVNRLRITACVFELSLISFSMSLTMSDCARSCLPAVISAARAFCRCALSNDL